MSTAARRLKPQSQVLSGFVFQMQNRVDARVRQTLSQVKQKNLPLFFNVMAYFDLTTFDLRRTVT
jgi:hypothetical protein